MFSKDYRIISTPTQRKTRYSIAASRVEKVAEEMHAEIQRLGQESKKVQESKKNSTYYSLEAGRIQLKREELLEHLAVLREPDSIYCIPPLHPIRYTQAERSVEREMEKLRESE
jgi:hypothetical protein